MKSTILWDITPCSPLIVNRRFRGTYHLHLFLQNGLHGVISQKMELFMTTGVRTSNPAQCSFYSLN
jgi:hypothetical protein